MICKKIEISKWDKGRMTVSVGSVVSVILNRQLYIKSLRIQVRDKIKPDKFIAYRALLYINKVDYFTTNLLPCNSKLKVPDVSSYWAHSTPLCCVFPT